MLSWSTVRRSTTLLLVTGLLAAGVWSSDRAPREETATAAPRPAEPAELTETPVPAVDDAAEDVPSAPRQERAKAAGKPAAALTKPSTKTFSLLGVTWDAGSIDETPEVEVRWRSLEDGWSDWTALEASPVEPAGQDVRPGTDPLWVGESDGVDVRVSTTSGKAPTGVRVATVTDGEGGGLVPAATTVGQPRIISRASWGARSGSTCSAPVYGASMLGTTLHHTAGSNGYTKAQSAGIVRSTQAYHVSGQGWCDIGYNFLVDKYGQIFEGRKGGITRMVRGAHAGVNAANERTIGVSMMGNYDVAQVPSAMKTAVADLVAWRHSLAGLKATGTYSLGGRTVNRIMGHRDVKSTACPGRYGYSWLTTSGGLRSLVAKRLAATSTAPAKPAPTGLRSTGATSTTLSFDWDAVSGAEKYHVKLSTSSTMTNPKYGKFTASEGTVTGLQPGTKYYASVVVVDPDRNVRLSPYSPAPHPTATTSMAKAPTNLRSTSATSTSLTFDWDHLAGVRKYHVKLSTSSTLSNPVYGKFTESRGTVTGLKPGTKYWFAVAGVDPARNVLISPYTAAPHPSASTSSATVSGNALTVPSSRSFSLGGAGYGHGIGMSQHGAQGAAAAGLSASRIIAYYYPGTTITTTSGVMRVLLTGATSTTTTVKARSGLRFRDVTSQRTTTLPTTVSGRTVTKWRMKPLDSDASRTALQYAADGTWRRYQSILWSGAGQIESTTASPVTLYLPSGATAAYRGSLRSSPPSAGSRTRDTVNVVGLEDYVRGVLSAEMPSGWRAAALQAQSMAARTYGVRARTASRYYDICDTTACQVYRGASAETASTDAAIRATKGKIVSYGGKPALTQFSSSSGGRSAAGSAAYLKDKEDRYDGWSGNTVHRWRVTVKASTLERQYPSVGTLRRLDVTKRTGTGTWGGRVVSLRLTGSKGTKTITGNDARWALGLRSNWFRLG